MSQAARRPRIVAEIPKNAREVIRVSLDEYRGYDLISVRVWANDPDRGAIPIKSGFAMRVDRLSDLVEAVKEAERIAHQEGLLAKADGATDGG